MNVVRKLSLICVLFCAAALSSANGSPTDNQVGVCFVPLLKAMGKISADFQSNSPPPAPIVCYLITELSTNMIRETFHSSIEAKIPNDADCLTLKFDQHRTVFDVIKIRLIEESNTLNDTEKQRQLKEARNELTNSLENIVVDCPTEKEKFTNIFHTLLGIKNDTLEAHQAEYCLARYTVENNILELGVTEVWNPHNIDPESVDCDGIVTAARIDSEREIRSVISVMPKTSGKLDCIMDLFRTGNTFNSVVALKVLYSVDLPKETKEAQGIIHSRNFTNFMKTSYPTCVKNVTAA